MVYFIGENWEKPVKIGKARDPEKRLRALQTSNPYKLKILRLAQGDIGVEKFFHKKLAKSRLNGEWFEGKDVYVFVSFLDELQDEYLCGIRQEFIDYDVLTMRESEEWTP